MKMYETKKDCIVIYLTGDFTLKEGEMTTVILELGDKGNVTKVEFDGVEREFAEQKQIYIKGIK